MKNKFLQAIKNGNYSWRGFLRFASKLYRYSFDQTVTIYMTMPTATLLTTVKQWNNAGFRVKKGEKGIPLRMSNGSTKYVFDISQIHNGENFTVWEYSEEADYSLYRHLEDTLGYTAYNVMQSLGDNAYDFFVDYVDKSIKDSLKEEEKEFIINSCAYLSLSRLGITDVPFNYDFDAFIEDSNPSVTALEMYGSYIKLYSKTFLDIAKTSYDDYLINPSLYQITADNLVHIEDDTDEDFDELVLDVPVEVSENSIFDVDISADATSEELPKVTSTSGGNVESDDVSEKIELETNNLYAINNARVNGTLNNILVADTTAKANYNTFAEMYPSFFNRKYSYMRYDGGENYEPLTMEWLDRNHFALAHHYILNGDVMYDPEVVFEVDYDKQTLYPVSYTNSGLGYYREYSAGSKDSCDCNDFVSVWLNENLKYQPYALSTANRYYDDKSVNFSDYTENETRYDIIFTSNNDGTYSAVNMLEYNAELDTFKKYATIDGENIEYVLEDTSDKIKSQIGDFIREGCKNIDKKYVAYALADYLITAHNNGVDLKEKVSLHLANDFIRSNCEEAPILDFLTEKIADDNTQLVLADDYSEAKAVVLRNLNYYDFDDNDNEKTHDILSAIFYKNNELKEFTDKVYEAIEVNSRLRNTKQPLAEFTSDTPLAENDIIVTESNNYVVKEVTDTYTVVDNAGTIIENEKAIFGNVAENLSENGSIISVIKADTVANNEKVDDIEQLSIEEGIINSTDKAFEIENSTTDYGNETENERKKSGKDVKIGDKFLYNDREYTVTSEIGIYPDDIGVSYEEQTGSSSYVITQNISRYKLAENGVFLGNSEIETTYLLEKAEKNPVENQLKQHDFIITDDKLGVGTPKEKVRANLNAINVLKEIEFDNRLATPEEQEVLSKYVGWGGLSEIFDESNDRFATERIELITSLSPDEYEKARASSNTAFYTQPIVIEAIYKALDKFGFKGGKILEPAMGVGNFFGKMPKEMRDNSQLYGVENDSISGRIAKKLYPSAEIQVKGYEETNFKNNTFDVAIGNVPFGEFGVYDKDYTNSSFKIHDYFFAKTLDKVKEGGIVAFITSAGTLDKKSSKIRRYISDKAEFIGAIRLPTDTFKENAGTEVLSDIVFLKKRTGGKLLDNEIKDWVNVDEVWKYTETLGLPFYEQNRTMNSLRYWDSDKRTFASLSMNKYFVENPHMIAGEISKKSSRFGMALNVIQAPDTSLADVLAEKISYLEAKFTANKETVDDNVYDIATVDGVSVIEADKTVENGTICKRNDKYFIREGNVMRLVDLSSIGKAKIKNAEKLLEAYVPFSQLSREAIRVQLQEDKDEDEINEEFEEIRVELNKAYDKFAEIGLPVEYLSSLIDNEKNFYLTSSLVNVNKNGRNYELSKGSDLFTKRTIHKIKRIEHCDTSEESLTASLNLKGEINLEYMSQLTGFTPEKLIDDLNGVYMFRNPQKFADYSDITTGWESADEYLSGDIYEKLEKLDNINYSTEKYPYLAVNRERLEAVKPELIPAKDISINLGASWIPEDVIDDFIKEKLGISVSKYADYSAHTRHYIDEARWFIENKASAKSYDSAISQYGTSRKNALEIIEDSLNLKSCTVKDKVYDPVTQKEKYVLNKEETLKALQKQEFVKQTFEDWVVLSPERVKRLEKIYNDTFNRYRARKYDGSMLTFDEQNSEIELNPHQKDAVARILFGGNTLLAHSVGAGKTYTMASACMKLKQIGVSKKSLIVVPNHLVGQFGKEFLQLYPNANILTATSDDLSKSGRKKFVSKLATNDFDAIIMAYSTFGKISVSKDRRERYIRETLDELEEAIDSCDNKWSVKQIEAKKKSLEKQLESLEFLSQDDELLFEELGVDQLFIDEAHNFKNLSIATKIQHCSGLSHSDSKRADDLYLKVKYINEQNGSERGVVFATGTPISNSICEAYIMQNYLQPSYLKRQGLQHFDNWIGTFGKVYADYQFGVTGNIELKNRVKFQNVPELIRGFQNVADVKTSKSLNLQIPKLKDGKYTICISKPTTEQKNFILECGERAEAIHSGNVDPREDNMLKISSDGMLCALDYRLIDENAADCADSKINQVVENVYNVYERYNDEKYAQAIFLDKSTPKEGFNLYDDIKNKLVDKGIPEEEIAFVHSAKNDSQKLALFNKVSEGEVRVIIGSTEKMGAGTNMQKKLCALHHVSVPWRPADVEQREGRILRFGNQCDEVEIFRYVTEETFDSYSWQTIENKSSFISQIFTEEIPTRETDDIDDVTLNYAEIKALASGNPLIIDYQRVSNEVKQYEALKSNLRAEKLAMREKIAEVYPKQLQRAEKSIDTLTKEVEYIKTIPCFSETNPFSIVLGGKTYTEKEEASKRLSEMVFGHFQLTDLPLGHYRGHKLLYRRDAMTNQRVLVLHNEQLDVEYKKEFGVGIGNFARLDNLITDDIPNMLARAKENKTVIEKNIAIAEEVINTPFKQQDKYDEAVKKKNEIMEKLGINSMDDTISQTLAMSSADDVFDSTTDNISR